MLITILAGAIAGGTSILYAALGETISERAGVINVGTEGTMLVGALAAVAATVETGSAWLGVLAGAGAGAALAAVFAIVTIWREANQLAAGLALMFLALGLTSLYGASYVGGNVDGFNEVKLPLLGQPAATRQGPLPPRRARLCRLRGRAGSLVAAVPQPLRACCCEPRANAPRRCWPMASRRRACARSRSSPAARSQASAAPSWRWRSALVV